MALFAGLLLAGCGQDSAGDASPASEPAATEKSEAAASVEEYTLRGTILGLDQDAKAAVISHEEIEGWMDAMTMTFPVKEDADWSKLKVGSKIQATVFVSDDEVYIGGVEIQTE
jgi:Cu/Ag efflux protein CusF